MRRAILLLAALTAGASGCSSNHCPNGGTLTVYWQPPQGGFTANGALLGCDQAGVATVDVYIDNQFSGTFSCHGPSADGITLIGFDNQVVAVEIDGYDASRNLLYQGVVTNQPTTFCADTFVDVTAPALTGNLTVQYGFTDSFTCSGGTYIWYTLLDATRNQVIDEVGPSSINPQAIPCGSTISLLDVPFGNYTVTRIQEVQLSGSTYSTAHATCSPQSFGHFVTADVSPTVQVPPSPGTCF